MRLRASLKGRPLAVLASLTLLAALGCSADRASGNGGSSESGRTEAAPPSIPKAGADSGLAITLATSVPSQSITVPVGPAAPDPLAAVQTFANAELQRDAHGAWSLLSQADRQRYQNPQVWAGERAQRPRLQAIDNAAITSTRANAGSAPADSVEVTAEVRFDPALDQNLGMIPSSASAQWLVVPEDGGWRVAYQRSAFDAHLPPLTQASDTAVQWARARQRCESPGISGAPVSDESRLEVVGGVVGLAGLANRLCKTTATVRAETPSTLDPAEAAPVVAAFGPQSLQWARVVPLAGAVPQRLVMGPLGDRWIAIGVLAP